MEKKYLQLPRFQTHQTKSEAISLVEQHVNENLGDFKDGEEIIVEYLNEYGIQVYSPAVIKIDNNEAKIDVAIIDSDTLKIFEGQEEPIDKDNLWLADVEDSEITSGETSNLREEIKLLKKTIKSLQDVVNKHDYALSNTLAGGDIIVNAEKFDLENEYDPEKPDGAPDEGYATGDTIVTSFEVYVANSPLSDFSGGDNASLYRGAKYPLKLKMYNAGMEPVKETDDIVIKMTCFPRDVAYIENRVLFGVSSGYAEIAVTVESGNHTVGKAYEVHFDYNEKPDYPIYSEPNVHHQLVKSAQTLKILTDNFNYLLVGEFCWCIEENALYLKEKAANGTIQLFKINGGGIIPPETGETITYAVNKNGVFIADSSEGSVNVTDGVLTLVGTVDENGRLILNDIN